MPVLCILMYLISVMSTNFNKFQMEFVFEQIILQFKLTKITEYMILKYCMQVSEKFLTIDSHSINLSGE